MDRKRESYLDFARGIAIFEVTFVHILSKFNLYYSIDTLPYIQRVISHFLIKFGTPTFIILFGIMIELVYVRKTKELGYKWLFKKVINRFILIYIAYAISTLTSYMYQPIEWDYFIRQLLYLEPVTNVSILIFYSFAILLIPVIVYIRNKIGLLPIFIFSLFVFSIQRYIPDSIIPDNFKFLASNTLGIGGLQGPSTFNSLLPISLGLLYAKYVITDKLIKPKIIIPTIIVLILSLILVTPNTGIYTVLEDFMNLSFRGRNDIEYYIIGSGFALATILISYICVKYINTKEYLKKITDPIVTLGLNSLVTYTTGTVVLNFIPKGIELSSIWYLIPIAFVITLIQVLIAKFDKYIKEFKHLQTT